MSQNPKNNQQSDLQPTLIQNQNPNVNHNESVGENDNNNVHSNQNLQRRQQDGNGQNMQSSNIHAQINHQSDQKIPQQPLQQQQFHSLDPIMQQNLDNLGNMDNAEQQNPISSYANRIRELQEKEQILKYSVADRQEGVKKLFMQLYGRKKKLLELAIAEFNRTVGKVDIGLYEEFMELRNVIKKQEEKIDLLHTQIHEQQTLLLSQSNQNPNSQRDAIMLRQKRQDIQIQIESGRRFAASQYVRDYLERTYIHKVSYQDVKYQYEMKTKLKEYLRLEKESYERRRDELKRMIEVERATKDALEDQKARLEAKK